MDGIEEVNVNAWNDIEGIHQGGRSEKSPEHFASPQPVSYTHLDVYKRQA